MGIWGEPAFCIMPNFKYLCRCTGGDIDSFFMLFFDNFSSLLGILGAMIGTPMIANDFDYTYYSYFSAYNDMVFRKVCPGIGCALIFGNVWYAWMAAKLAAKENRTDVTALPYGINTPAGFVTVFAVMLPVAFTYSPKILTSLGVTPPNEQDYAWNCFSAACAANFLGGVFEVCGIVVGDFVRKNVPRAALFGPISGVGFVWLGFNPLIEVCREPLIGLIPLALCFTGFFAKEQKGIYIIGNMHIPAAVIIFMVGTILWWCGLARWDTENRVDDNGDLNEVSKMANMASYASDRYVGKNEFSPFACLGFSLLEMRMIAIQIPIAIVSFLETIENVEAAELVGDTYNVREAMLADGLGTMFGACCGAVMPTTVYIGHRRHKATGAGAMYSLLNGIAYFILMMSGLTGLLFYLIDQVSIGVILIAVGLMIVQHALEVSVPRHYPCLMIGIMFVVADMVYFDQFDYTASVCTRSLGRMQGVANMAPGGGIMCSMIVPAILCDLVDCRFIRASIFSLIAMVFSLFGLMHGNNYVFANGHEMHVHGSHSYELGEVMMSTETYSIQCNAGPTCPFPFAVAPPNVTAGEEPNAYYVNHFETPTYLRVPTKRSTAFNEGWRFAVGYAAVFVFCMLHAAVQMSMCKGKDGCAAILDNGKAEAEETTSTSPKAKETAEA